MNSRPMATTSSVKPLLNLIEQRFDLRLDSTSLDHLRMVHEHYQAKVNLLRYELGESVYESNEYAKAMMVSEAARLLMLTEIYPRPRKKKKTRIAST